jgi:MFS family permease
VKARAGLLAHRDFRLLWTGETTSCLGSSIGGIALPLVALDVLHASVFAVSALTAAAWLPWVLIGLPAGAWVDRWPRRPVMIAADVMSVAAFGSVPVAAWCGVLTTAQLIFVALAGGTASVFFKTAYRALLPALVAAEDLLEGNAKLQGSEQAANVAGPGAAGVLAQTVGAGFGVLADAVSFAVSAICLSRIRVTEPRRVTRRRNLRHEIGEGLAIVVRDPLLRASTTYGCLSNLTLVGYQAVLVVFLIRIVGLSAGVTGLLIALSSLGGVLGALLAGPAARRFGTARAVLYGRMLLTPAGLLIPLADRGPRLALFVLGSVTLIVAIVAGNVIWQGWLQSYYPSKLLGRVSTSVQVFNYGSIPLGAVVAGSLASHLGVRAAVWIMLGGSVLSTLVLLTGPLPHLRELPSAGFAPQLAAGDDDDVHQADRPEKRKDRGQDIRVPLDHKHPGGHPAHD